MLNEVREQRARVFKNGRSRAVRIPKEFEFEGDEVTIRTSGPGRKTVGPHTRAGSPSEAIQWLRQQPPRTEDDFPDIEDFPPRPVDLERGG